MMHKWRVLESAPSFLMSYCSEFCVEPFRSNCDWTISHVFISHAHLASYSLNCITWYNVVALGGQGQVPDFTPNISGLNISNAVLSVGTCLGMLTQVAQMHSIRNTLCGHSHKVCAWKNTLWGYSNRKPLHRTDIVGRCTHWLSSPAKTECNIGLT